MEVKNGRDRILSEEHTRRSDLKLTQRAWVRWRGYVEASLRWKEIESLTSRIRRLSLIRSHIEVWLSRYKQVSSMDKEKYQRAISHLNQTTARRAIHAWKDYCTSRKRFRADSDQKIMAQAFSAFLRYVIQRKLYREHVKCVTSFYEKYLLRTALERWAIARERLHEWRDNEAKDAVASFRDRKLLVKSFTIWMARVREGRARAASAKAFAFRAASITIEHVLHYWRRALRERLLLNSMEDKSDKWRRDRIIQIYLSRMVDSHRQLLERNRKVEELGRLREETLKRRAFEHWTRRTRVGRTKKMELENARDHWRRRLAETAFYRLKRYTAEKVREKCAQSYREKRIILKTMRSWIQLRERKRLRETRIALLGDRIRLRNLRRVMAIFKARRESALREYAAASTVANRRLVAKVVNEWKRQRTVRSQRRALLQQNRERLEEAIVQEVLSTWRRISAAKVALRSSLETIRYRREMKRGRESLLKWRDFSRKMRFLRGRVSNFAEARMLTVARDHVLRLAAVWVETRAIKEKEELASCARKAIAQRKCLRKWFAYVTWKKEKLRECSAAASLSGKNLGRDMEVCASNIRSKRKPPMIPLYLRDEYNPDGL